MKCYAPSELEVTSQLRDEADEEAIRRMLIRKHDLLAQLEQLETAESSGIGIGMDPESDPVKVELLYAEDCLKLSVAAAGRLIHAVVIFAEGIPDYACHLLPAQASCHVALPLVRHLAADLRTSVFLAQEDQHEDAEDRHLRVVDVVVPLPTFALIRWLLPASGIGKCNYLVRVRLHERIQRVISFHSLEFLFKQLETARNS